MNNSLKQNIDIKQTLQTSVYITPQMKQSLAMLQMPLQELTQEINNIIEDNPLLEVVEKELDLEDDHDGDSSDNKDTEKDELADTITSDDWQEYIGYDVKDDISYRPAGDEESIDYEQFLSSKPSLYEHLLLQLKVLGLTKQQLIIGEFIIGNLSDDGYFKLDKIIASTELSVDETEFEEILNIIKSFDPIGVAAGSLEECILTQIDSLNVDTVYLELAYELLCKYRTELTTYKYDEILKSMSIERDTFDYILSLIKKTDPKPGLNYSSSDTNYIVPDVFIFKNGEKFDIVLNESGLPAFRLNRYYLQLLKRKAVDKVSRQYIKEKLKNAVWVIDSLQKRQKAIYKVVAALIDVQKEFLMLGIDHIKPLKLKDIAVITELHESTISRVTSGKYAMTEHGLIELKSFFVKSIESATGDKATTEVKLKIKELVDSESDENPLSDQNIVEELEKFGITIARRTVAKYRDELNIKTMSQRKRLRR